MSAPINESLVLVGVDQSASPRARGTRNLLDSGGTDVDRETGAVPPQAGARAGPYRKMFMVMVGLMFLSALICGGGVAFAVVESRQGRRRTTLETNERIGRNEAEALYGPIVDEDDLATPETGVDLEEAPVLPPIALKSVPVNAALGSYDEPIPLPVIPVAVVVLPSGKVLAWSAYSPDDFGREDRYVDGGGGFGKTQHAVWDPASGDITGMIVSNTDHDMFCPGISMMPNGDIIVIGGQNADKTSIYQLASKKWVPAADMAISRGYVSSALLSNGKVFVLGGSWSGPKDLKKDAEIYDPTLGSWSKLPGIQASHILTNDPEDNEKGGKPYRADNYGMFHSWSNGTVFHAGPSKAMHWFSTDGEGTVVEAGERPGPDIANGNSVMYDQGKILNCGGAEAFAKYQFIIGGKIQQFPASDFATHITINEVNSPPTVRELSPMKHARVYANGVVLPDGKVLITGGAWRPKEFSDQYAYKEPEIWDPATEKFTLLEAKHKFGRTYHSTAALLPDGRVFTGGGGLCGGPWKGERTEDGNRVLCKGPVDPNHLDFEVFNPPYLFAEDGSLAERPTISLSTATADYGAKIEVTSSEQLMMVSMIRMSSATHSTNTDQRRIELCGPFTTPCEMSPVRRQIPSDPGIALGGNWMIFGISALGTPSKAEILLVGL